MAPTTAAPVAKDPSASPPPPPERRRVVLPDPVALKYLGEDPAVTVVETGRVLEGFELYLVEQWACSRRSPALAIVTYTGDKKHSIVVGVLEAQKEEIGWSPRLEAYFKAIKQHHARPKDTDFGELMVTNLSSFPSALTVIPVPDGDLRHNLRVFIVNENLKRLGCSGRSGLTLSDPTPATQAKFTQLYKISEKISFQDAVVELVKLCQVALFIFGLLDQVYIDGLLCDVTEAAINSWWTDIGSEYFNIEPTDGILGPTTVAALLGTLVGARNRLSYCNAPVSKDVFDVDCTKRGIGAFQKSQKLERTRRLDRQTLLKLHQLTAKAAAGEGWGVQKAVKSTVAEIGGKRGELVIGMVGGRDKGNIGDIETLDLDKFIKLTTGERPKWLWHGKPRRTLNDYDHTVPPFGAKDVKEDVLSQAGSRRAQSMPADEEQEVEKATEELMGSYSAPPASAASTMDINSGPSDKDALRKTVFKSVAGKVSDARSGLGRIRDAVGTGLRSHVNRPSKDDAPNAPAPISLAPSIASLAQSSTALTSPVAVGRAFTWRLRPEEYLNGIKERYPNDSTPVLSIASTTSGTPSVIRQSSGLRRRETEVTRSEPGVAEIAKSLDAPIITKSVPDPNDLLGPIQTLERTTNLPISLLQRRHSVHVFTPSLYIDQLSNEAKYSRRLSFSAAEDAVLGWDEVYDISSLLPSDAAHQQLSDGALFETQAELARSLYAHLAVLQSDLSPWVSSKLSSVESLDETFTRQQHELQSLYLHVSDAYQRNRHSGEEIVGEERHRLNEAVKDVEVLVAKLEYEIGALVDKVQDVEDGVGRFEMQVADVERRAEELKTVLETETWFHWFVRTLTGIGTGPNITQSTQGVTLRRVEEEDMRA
ncbi:unnamed protein product [Sordaria macrospora k-hell]|uniref:WGS project CABT00000000 data, contig 2.4 n=2 Tax=Sordaria macrospora TaxID=5147 RepID=F7VR86_SORMK|nr:uncharacterized protein SMAC_01584 [Sordaria macrospora k-hell]KAH7634697.1 hypothetical protein B0T09DRAFT_253270 [Sordaria sp. MPI-SDFR-AT-0083]CCC08020.1 unnamed protein product [Sordaria macrospora k-hell]